MYCNRTPNYILGNAKFKLMLRPHPLLNSTQLCLRYCISNLLGEMKSVVGIISTKQITNVCKFYSLLLIR